MPRSRPLPLRSSRAPLERSRGSVGGRPASSDSGSAASRTGPGPSVRRRPPCLRREPRARPHGEDRPALRPGYQHHRSFPVERSLLPEVREAEEEDGQEEEHLAEHRPAPLPEDHRPRVEEGRFHVEDDEYHRDDEELDGEPFSAHVENPY